MYYVIYKNSELCHHGIKGQKWGVVNGPPYPLGKDQMSKRERASSGKFKRSIKVGSENISNVRNYGWNRGHAMNVANRMHYYVRNDKERMGKMSEDQKESLKRAEKYWNDRAKGKKTNDRSLIRRMADDNRSKPFEQRYTEHMIDNLSNFLVSEVPGGILSVPVKNALDVAFDELVYNIIFGHF